MYTVYVLPQALKEAKSLPGNVRQRVKRIIDGLAKNPGPSASIELADVIIPSPHVTLCRLRIEKWRIVDAIDDDEKFVDVLAIRRRPPYDYGDLDELIRTLQ